jgi:hypothetical protein
MRGIVNALGLLLKYVGARYSRSSEAQLAAALFPPSISEARSRDELIPFPFTLQVQ